MSDFLNDLNESSEQASAESAFSNFGRLEIQPTTTGYKVWKERPDGTRYAEPVAESTWRNTAAKDRFMEVNFFVHISEIDPTKDWVYTRKVSILGGKKTDWAKIVKPSIEKVFGSVDFGQLQGRWVEVQDVPQVRDSEYNTIKFLRVFPGKSECLAAYNEKIAGYQEQSQQAQTPAATPPAPPAPPVPPVATKAEIHPDVWTTESWNNQAKPWILTELEKGTPAEEVAKGLQVEVKYVTQYVTD